MSNKIMYCCDQKARKAKTPDGLFYIHCSVCNKRAEGKTAGEAEKQFEALQEHAPVNNLPSTVAQLPKYMVSRLEEIAALTVPFVARDKPALTRLLKNNMRHIMLRSKDQKFAEVWQTAEGVESIVFAIEEAMALGAELGKMGSVVPFGSTVEFIPAIEAYEFALTNGGSPPFRWIQIDMIHENDICKISRINGEFTCSIKPGIPRGELVSVAVYGHNNRLGHVIGELYDRERLLGKAERHSSSYKAYLRDLHAFRQARTEQRTAFIKGREYAVVKIASDNADKYYDQNLQQFKEAEAAKTLKKDNKGEFAEITMNKKGGGTWNKKIYRSDMENPGTESKKLYFDEITNPYEGPDQPEMLRKAAGKSFLGKYAKVRNSEAAMEEVKGTPESEVEATIDRSLDAAFSVMEAEPVQTMPPTMDTGDYETDIPEEDVPPVKDDSLMSKVKQKVEENAEAEPEDPEQELDIF